MVDPSSISLFDLLDSALRGMVRGPRPLTRALEAAAENLSDDPISMPPLEVLRSLEAASAGDEALGLLRKALARWDNETEEWAGETDRHSPERRALIYAKLGFDEAWQRFADEKLPFQRLDRATVIADKHIPWYTSEIRRGRDFYWSAYARQLKTQGWSESSIAELDESTTSVVERIANPTSEKAWQSKGLVVGYVQSGKTANFTGVVAKAADAGYKLIIILGGTLDVLRSQTQRRVDKDLIGQELLDDDPKYIHDVDWDKFIKHGGKPSEQGAFDFSRLTGPDFDYKQLRYGREALQFQRPIPPTPFFDAANLWQANTKIAVVKKNSKILKKLLADLTHVRDKRMGAPLGDVPTLIIDDESDQAGLNVGKARKPDEQNERTETNKAIVGLLQLLPRSQYVGYTATPFANVFVDPTDEKDIFPKDFIIALPRPREYMGVANFYDLDVEPSEEGPNKKDFVRSVTGEDSKPENLQSAIDCFVLTGALKLWRASVEPELKFRHHTMLVHISQRTDAHRIIADEVKATFATAGYNAGHGLDRLETLFNDDFKRVSRNRNPELPFPEHFNELADAIGECLQKISDGPSAVLTVNNKHKDETPDFDKQPVWKILIGGTKLSRGYTVEGLTVSYYRRKAGAADTLMQMGRWFGFRRGYGDLVRLFIGTNEPDGAKKTIDLYEAFGAVCRDEEMFRKELARYASMEEPRITPAKIPPLVPQHMLRPTAPNKMRNAYITGRNFGGELSESTYSPKKPAGIKTNNQLLSNLVDGKSAQKHELRARTTRGLRTLNAITVSFKTDELIPFLKGFRWDDKSDGARRLNPLHLQIEFLEGKHGNHGIKDWILFGPKISDARATTKLAGEEFDVVFRGRNLDNPARFNTYNDPVHRAFAEYITGVKELSETNAELEKLRSPHRGVMIYYPITDVEYDHDVKPKGPFSVGFTLLFPKNKIKLPISFGVRNKDEDEDAVVSTDISLVGS